MKVLETIAEFQKARSGAPALLGLVPTMGALHEGHLSLVRRARQDNSTLAVSIFVNPAQFGPLEDYATYPRDIKRDLELLEKEGVDLVFAPSMEEIYPPTFDTYVEVGALTRRLEGEFRHGHFRGVATVVVKLLVITRPDRAYLGQKDAQQALVIQRLNADLNLGAEIVVLPTVREPDGLALSSRNANLSLAERKAAPVLYKSLCLAQQLWQQGERNAERIREEMSTFIFEGDPLAKIDYVSIADASTLEELERIDRPALASLAVRIGKVRLIDNITIPGTEG